MHRYQNYLVSNCNCLFWDYDITLGRQGCVCSCRNSRSYFSNLFDVTVRSLISSLGDHVLNGSPYAIRPLSVCLSCPVCLSCLAVTLVYCRQTVGWIKMKLGMQVGLGPGHMVLDGDPSPPPQKGHSPQFLYASISYGHKYNCVSHECTVFIVLQLSTT